MSDRDNHDPGDEDREVVPVLSVAALRRALADIDERIAELRRDREIDWSTANIPCDAAARVRP